MKPLPFLLVLALASPAGAITIDGHVEKTFYLDPHLSSDEGRIGVRVTSYGKVHLVHPGSPAQHAGLQKHDYIVTVDGRKHNVDNISGEPGTSVCLVVKRQGTQFNLRVHRVEMSKIAYADRTKTEPDQITASPEPSEKTASATGTVQVIESAAIIEAQPENSAVPVSTTQSPSTQPAIESAAGPAVSPPPESFAQPLTHL